LRRVAECLNRYWSKGVSFGRRCNELQGEPLRGGWMTTFVVREKEIRIGCDAGGDGPP
jgi:hypothetical protein